MSCAAAAARTRAAGRSPSSPRAPDASRRPPPSTAPLPSARAPERGSPRRLPPRRLPPRRLPPRPARRSRVRGFDPAALKVKVPERAHDDAAHSAVEAKRCLEPADVRGAARRAKPRLCGRRPTACGFGDVSPPRGTDARRVKAVEDEAARGPRRGGGSPRRRGRRRKAAVRSHEGRARIRGGPDGPPRRSAPAPARGSVGRRAFRSCAGTASAVRRRNAWDADGTRANVAQAKRRSAAHPTTAAACAAVASLKSRPRRRASVVGVRPVPHGRPIVVRREPRSREARQADRAVEAVEWGRRRTSSMRPASGRPAELRRARVRRRAHLRARAVESSNARWGVSGRRRSVRRRPRLAKAPRREGDGPQEDSGEKDGAPGDASSNVTRKAASSSDAPSNAAPSSFEPTPRTASLGPGRGSGAPARP